jgi:hypothetical protein
MQVIINIDKRHFIFLVVFIGLIGGLTFAYNAGGTGGNATIMGHSFDETAPGTFEYTSEHESKSFVIYRGTDFQPAVSMLDLQDYGWFNSVSINKLFDYSLHVHGNTNFDGPVGFDSSNYVYGAFNLYYDNNDIGATSTYLDLCEGTGVTCYEGIETLGDGKALCADNTGKVGICPWEI